jgi:molybdopterin/thiamine biosynthesis adenylyltransferase
VTEALRFSEADAGIDDRFSRFRLISWWDQSRLAAARVLVVGAGALGNELIKNLALLGFGNVLVVDLDAIENSNLSRSVLFREADCGSSKAEVVAARAKDIFPDIKARGLRRNIVYDLGLGVYRWADVILGGLDNREARVAINRAAARVGKPWIDGAIERLQDVARVFDPATGPCYECTMSEVD